MTGRYPYEWVSRHLWVGGRRRVGISVWATPHGPVLSRILGDSRLPLVTSHAGYLAVRIPLTRWCLATYRREQP